MSLFMHFIAKCLFFIIIILVLCFIFPDFSWHAFCTSLDLSVACEFFSFTLSLQFICFSCLRRTVTFFRVWLFIWWLSTLRLWWSRSGWWNMKAQMNLCISPVSSLGSHVFLNLILFLVTVGFMSRVHETMQLLKSYEILNSFIFKLSLFLSLFYHVVLNLICIHF